MMHSMARSALWLALGLALVPACFRPSYENPACGVGGTCPEGFACGADNVCVRGLDNELPDAATADVAMPDTKATVCVGTFVRVCVDPQTADVALDADQLINTETSLLCAPYTSTPAVDACVIAGKSISVVAGRAIRAIGKKKLILLATDADIALAGTLNASSTMYPMAIIGAGAGQDACNAGTLPTMIGESGGGAGGSFGSIGGRGGNTPSGGAGGIAGPAIPVGGLTLHGGCAGQSAVQGGPGGAGGGAVALIAKGAVKITGTVNASGAGGQVSAPFVPSGGGGGGGAGGMIVLDASSVEIANTSKCFANGGGGAQGSDTAAGNRGSDPATPSTPAAGGDSGGPGEGGQGGDGAARLLAARAGEAGESSLGNKRGGGGGGGGVGYILLVANSSSIPSSAVSPPITRP